MYKENRLSCFKSKRRTYYENCGNLRKWISFSTLWKNFTIKLYDVENNEIKESQVVGTEGLGHGALAILLSNLNVDVLICGGIGRGAIMALSGSNINVVGGVTGDCDTAVKAI